jgi:lipid-A-disaccharide synthase
MHAAAVVSALRRLDPGLMVEAVGGERLRAAGADVRGDLDRLSAMGTVEAAGSAAAHWRLLRHLDGQFAAGAYRAVLLVDYPGFHLRVARRAAARGIPVVYYIAPQLWAWGAWRAPTLRDHVRQLAVVLPFEESYFRSLGIPSTFVGHPLLDRPTAPSRLDARRCLDIDEGEPTLTVFPGLRQMERDRLWPVFRAAAVLLRRSIPGLRVVVAASEGLQPELEGAILSPDPAVALSAADAALCKSGTSTLEAALSGTPMVIAYRASPVSFWLARRLVRVPHVGLVNLVADRKVAPEFLQSAAQPDRLHDALLPLFDVSGDAARRQVEAFNEVRTRLGSAGAARRVAELVLAEAA